MKKIVLCMTLSARLSFYLVAQDIPTPSANLQTVPNGSYVIAMDNTLQKNTAGYFNLKAYGLIVYLLNNNVKVKWVIKTGKVKNDIDFSTQAEQLLPSLAAGGVTSDFKSGPFVIFATDTTGVAALVANYYTSAALTGNNRPKVYRLTTAALNVDIRYDMSGFKPKAAILNDGGNESIHTNFMTKAGIPSSNYMTTDGSSLMSTCFTFASEPHNGSADATIITTIKGFVQAGGNFLAECAAIETYENNASGHFHTTNGITVSNTNIASASVIFPNADLGFTQIDGAFSINKTGSVKNWTLAAGSTFINSEHNHASGGSMAAQSPVGASVARLNSESKGGLVFYLGNHNFTAINDIEDINGIRMYMNAFLTPVAINSNCNMGEALLYALPVHLVSFQGNLNKNNKVTLTWTVSDNETTNSFEVERSENGRDFTTVAIVLVSGKIGTESYMFHETINNNDKIMYRLKMIDKSHKADYSKILIFQTRAMVSSYIKIIGNPVNDKLTFSYTASATQLISIKIYDMSGRVVMNNKVNSLEGNNMMSLPLNSTFKTGMYVIEVNNGTELQTAKFVKQ